MASYRGHLMFSIPLGIAYGGLAFWQQVVDLPTALLAGGLCAAGGMLPDLDSDSGVPVRILFGLASVAIPLLLIRRLLAQGLGAEHIAVILGGLFLFIRYILSAAFKRLTEHRGMYHSVPAMMISGLAVFLIYHDPAPFIRMYVAAAVMLGFFSHLLLDELCAVDISGVRIKLNQFAGSALKLTSPSWTATLGAYALLAVLGYFTALEFDGPRARIQAWQRQMFQSGPIDVRVK